MPESLCKDSISTMRRASQELDRVERHGSDNIGAGSPHVSVIIPHYNDLEALQRCLEALLGQISLSEEIEVIVADNNSACGLQTVIDAAAGCRVVHATVQGAGPARNAGAAAARGQILAFLDSDCVPGPHWITNGVNALSAYDFMGGHVETIARNPDRLTPVEAWEIVFGFNFEHYINTEGYTGTGNMWVWRNVFDVVGGFRAGLSEDMDWSFRAQAAGFRLGYEKTVSVSHLAKSTWPDLITRWRRMLAEHYVLTRERPLGWTRWVLKTVAMPLSIAPHLIRVLSCNRIPDTRTKLMAASILVAHRVWRTQYMLRLLLTLPRQLKE